jgi:tetratricopeptide (TPR) repeat protein
LLVLADFLGGIAEIRAGNIKNAQSRLASQKTRYSSDNAMESNWVAGLEGEIALTEGQHDRAMARFKAAQKPAWSVLGRDDSTVFATNIPSRDGIARVQIARGDRAGAIEEYRRLTPAAPDHGSSAVLEPRYILALARLLRDQGDKVGASAEYARFLQLWAQADTGLPELSEVKQALNAAP